MTTIEKQPTLEDARRAKETYVAARERHSEISGRPRQSDPAAIRTHADLLNMARAATEDANANLLKVLHGLESTGNYSLQKLSMSDANADEVAQLRKQLHLPLLPRGDSMTDDDVLAVAGEQHANEMAESRRIFGLPPATPGDANGFGATHDELAIEEAELRKKMGLPPRGKKVAK